ncbi:MAG: hypothetical protein HYW23_03585 [Candidatus Aenigmarchaeota archaeon]|nr:hypothetical protein [Candidatus Aenigmarchaeota archaeon]
MNKTEILNYFLRKGAQINKEALEELENNQYLQEVILKSTEMRLPPVITDDFLKQYKNTSSVKEKIPVKNLSQILDYRYNFIKNILINNPQLTNLISINRIGDKIKQFSVIGVVTEHNNKKLVIEDTTGESLFEISEELGKYIIEDEVIGLACERQQQTNNVTNIVYPDIPLKRDASKTKTPKSCIFISDMHMDSPAFNEKYYKNFISWLKEQKDLDVFIFGEVSTKIEQIERLRNDISQTSVTLEKLNVNDSVRVKTENIEIMLSRGWFLDQYMKLWKSAPDLTLVNLFRKRNLNPKLTPQYYNNTFFLDTIPDIISLSDIGQPAITNYKGTTILTNGSFLKEPIYWVINLQTRETFKIDFSIT